MIENVQIRISDLLHAVFKRRYLILAFTAVGLVIGVLLSIVSYMRGEMAKEYAITSSFAVTSVTEDGLFTTKTNNPNSNDIYLAENMVDSVIYVMRSDRVLNAAIGKLNLVGVSVRDISGNLSMKQYNETQIVEMTLYWRSADEGVQILNAINAVAPDILIETLKIGGVSVVNEPRSRYIVGGSMNVSMWAYMAVLGMLVGMGVSVLELLLQPKLINPRDMEKVLELEVIGEIPQAKSVFKEKRSLLEAGDGSEAAHVRECFASAAHILRNRLGDAPHQCVYVTSASSNEGKTTTAANLALELSELEHKVLLVDLDVHNPSLGALFLPRVEYGSSLNALYRGEASAADAIIRVTGYLDLLPATREPSPLPLDEAMLALIRDLAQQYDYIIIDTAPVGRTADTMNLNRIAQNALFVVRYDVSGMNDIRQALERMDKSGIRIIGSIVNDVKKLGKKQYGDYYAGRSYAAAPHRQTEHFVPVQKAAEAPPAVETAVDAPVEEAPMGSALSTEKTTEPETPDEAAEAEAPAAETIPDAAAEAVPETDPEDVPDAESDEPESAEEASAESAPAFSAAPLLWSSIPRTKPAPVEDAPLPGDDVFRMLSGAGAAETASEKKPDKGKSAKKAKKADDKKKKDKKKK